MNYHHSKRLLNLLAMIATIAIAADAYAGVLLGQVDDFSTGRQGWGIAGDVEADGGPTGAGDPYFAYTSTGGGGFGSRMVVPNGTLSTPSVQWSGDYLAEGVTGFELDVLNDGEADLDLRVAIGDDTTWYVSTDPVVIPKETAWTSVAFQISEDAMTGVSNESVASFDTVASSVIRVRILSSEALPSVAVQGGVQGDAVNASIGFDNFRAVGIPEPTALGMAAVAVGVAARRRRSV